MTLRLRRWQGKWIAEDKEAGYFAELNDCDAHTLAADFHAAEHIRLRVVAARLESPHTKPAPACMPTTEEGRAQSS